MIGVLDFPNIKERTLKKSAFLLKSPALSASFEPKQKFL